LRPTNSAWQASLVQESVLSVGLSWPGAGAAQKFAASGPSSTPPHTTLTRARPRAWRLDFPLPLLIACGPVNRRASIGTL
jgi:hypothetical protein